MPTTSKNVLAKSTVNCTSVAIANDQTSGARPDPKVMIGVFNRLRRANAAVHDGRLTEAEAIARDILDRDRQNAFAADEFESGVLGAAIDEIHA